jgi:hypothetical protein
MSDSEPYEAEHCMNSFWDSIQTSYLTAMGQIQDRHQPEEKKQDARDWLNWLKEKTQSELNKIGDEKVVAVEPVADA